MFGVQRASNSRGFNITPKGNPEGQGTRSHSDLINVVDLSSWEWLDDVFQICRELGVDFSASYVGEL